jgi:hypothetical protein
MASIQKRLVVLNAGRVTLEVATRSLETKLHYFSSLPRKF